MFRELVWGDRWYGLPCLDLDRLTPPRKEGDRPSPFMVVEDFDGELRDAGIGDGLGVDPFAGISFFRTLDMATYWIPNIAYYGRRTSRVKNGGRPRLPKL